MSAILSHHPNRIRWACRRGMLELDLFLLPFFDAQFSHLPEDEQKSFIALLECTDPQLFQWLMQKEMPPSEYRGIIDKVLFFKKESYSTLF